MTPTQSGRTPESHRPTVSRRQLLAGLGACTIGVGIAGCSEAVQQEFAAAAVRLPPAVGEEFGLAEVVTDSNEKTWEVTAGDEELRVRITSEYAGYQRSSAIPGNAWSADRTPLVARFAGFGPESTPGSGAAINVVASDLGVEEANHEFTEADTPIEGSKITWVVPELARHDEEVSLDEILAVHHAEALGIDELAVRGVDNFLLPAESVLPSNQYFPAAWSDWQPDDRWIVGRGNSWIPDDPSELRCLVSLGEQSDASEFVDATCPDCRLDDGETLATENTLLLAPASKMDPGPAFPLEPAEEFDAGYPTPMGGPTYSIGVIATPNAEIAGESVNPLTRISTAELLTSDLTTSLLASAGLTDADEVEWLRGPEEAQDIVNWLPFNTVSVLESDVALECYGGVVSGIHGPWAVAIHVAKVTDDDVVIPAAMHRRPVSTPDGRELIGDGSGFIDRQWTTRALELTADVFPSLVQDG